MEPIFPGWIVSCVTYVTRQRGRRDLADWLTYLDLEGKRPRTLYAYHREIARLLRAYPDHRVDGLHRRRHRSCPADRAAQVEAYRPVDLQPVLRVGHVAPPHRVSPMGLVARVKNPAAAKQGSSSSPRSPRSRRCRPRTGSCSRSCSGPGIRRAEARDSQRSWFDLARGRMFIDGKGGSRP